MDGCQCTGRAWNDPRGPLGPARVGCGVGEGRLPVRGGHRVIGGPVGGRRLGHEHRLGLDAAAGAGQWLADDRRGIRHRAVADRHDGDHLAVGDPDRVRGGLRLPDPALGGHRLRSRRDVGRALRDLAADLVAEPADLRSPLGATLGVHQDGGNDAGADPDREAADDVERSRLDATALVRAVVAVLVGVGQLALEPRHGALERRARHGGPKPLGDVVEPGVDPAVVARLRPLADGVPDDLTDGLDAFARDVGGVLHGVRRVLHGALRGVGGVLRGVGDAAGGVASPAHGVDPVGLRRVVADAVGHVTEVDGDAVPVADSIKDGHGSPLQRVLDTMHQPCVAVHRPGVPGGVEHVAGYANSARLHSAERHRASARSPAFMMRLVAGIDNKESGPYKSESPLATWSSIRAPRRHRHLPRLLGRARGDAPSLRHVRDDHRRGVRRRPVRAAQPGPGAGPRELPPEPGEPPGHGARAPDQLPDGSGARRGPRPCPRLRATRRTRHRCPAGTRCRRPRCCLRRGPGRAARDPGATRQARAQRRGRRRGHSSAREDRPMTETSAPGAPTREVALPPGATVDIYLTSSNLRLRGVDGDRIVVRALDGERLDDEITIDAAADVVRVRDAQSTWKLGPFNVTSRRSRDLAIDLPRMAGVVVRTLSGDVEAAAICGDSRWASASGDLRVSVEGGRVQLETMSGDAVLEASGTIALTARTVSGDLRVRARRLDELDASTTSGDVRIESELGGATTHVVNSVSGDVELVTASPVRLQVETIAGDVHASGPHTSEGARGRRTLGVGDGSVAVSVRTTSGDVRLRAVEGGATATPSKLRVQPTAAAAPAASEIADVPDAPAVPAAPVAPAPPVAPILALDAEEDTQAWNAPGPIVDRREADRLEVLRALERGDLDIETAARRLEILEQAGPRYFRGWC